VRGWKRILLVVLSVLALAAGAAVLFGGIALVALFGTSSVASSGPGRVFTPGAAIVASPQDLDHAPGSLERYELVVAARSERGGRVFVGIGAAQDVDRWLQDVPYANVTGASTDPLRLDAQQIPGTAVPARPEQQPFWLDSVAGIGEQELRWKPVRGDWRVVVAMDDGASPVEVRMRVDLDNPFAFPLGVVACAFGGLLLLVGVLLLVAALRGRGKPDLPAGVPGGYPEGYEPGAAVRGRPRPAPAPVGRGTDLEVWPPVAAPAPLPWEEAPPNGDYGR
jgi:hypothetical protein